MKHFHFTLLLLFSCLSAFEQEQETITVLQTTRKLFPNYYAQLTSSTAIVYEMGKYLDVGGTGASIRKTDTLFKQQDGSYAGINMKLAKEKDQYYVITESRKTKKYSLDTSTNPVKVNYELNNAYYLDNYFAMSGALNKNYPMIHHTFRNGFYTWKTLSNQNQEHSQFRKFTDERLQQLRDSISAVEDRNTDLTNAVIRNISVLNYEELKSRVNQLPASRYPSRYFQTAIVEIAKQNPEYFWKLAEDLPDKKYDIFSAVRYEKVVKENLKSVQGHEAIRKEYYSKK